MNTPEHNVSTIVHHEWVIGNESFPTTARDFADGIMVAEREMKELGVDLTYDDSYHVKSGDGYQIILYVDIEE